MGLIVIRSGTVHSHPLGAPASVRVVYCPSIPWGRISNSWYISVHPRGSISTYLCHFSVNTLRPRQNGHHLPDNTFKCIFLNENVLISIKVSLKFVPKCPINNIPALVQTMTCRQPGNTPLSEPVMVSLVTHICVNHPQWVKKWCKWSCSTKRNNPVYGVNANMWCRTIFWHSKQFRWWLISLVQNQIW